ncbi:MAG: methionine synthase, partial [Chloroflexi bacterium]|nr:methionine synthase [Chloroflexota bacterium]
FGSPRGRGNQGSRGLAEGGYASMVDTVLRRVSAQRLLLEYDGARSGGFEPLRGVPDDKVVVLGLVTTKSGVLERQEDLLARIDEAARHFPRELLALSPQCGFGTSFVGNNLTIDEQNAKLRLVAETAKRAWG